MSEHPNLSPGDPVSAIDGPALLVELSPFQRNVEAMASFAQTQGIRVRAHGKTHKCGTIARLQQAAGAVGLCCQKVSEAQAFVSAGVTDVLVSNEVIEPAKLRRLARLSGKSRIGICVDSALGLARLAEASTEAQEPLDVYVELDVGAGRCGVTTAQEAIRLIDAIQPQTKLRYAGIQAYQGRAQHLREPSERRAAIDEALRRIVDLRDAMSRRGLPIGIVTGAGTGTFYLEGTSGIYDEIQPGSYVFMDRDYGDNHAAAGVPRFEVSLTLLTTVISARPDFVVVDAGLKAHSVDSGMPAVHRRPDLAYDSPSDEHGVLRVTGVSPSSVLPSIGERLQLVPGHCDPTVNLHDWLVVHDRGRVVDCWAVEARGAIT